MASERSGKSKGSIPWSQEVQSIASGSGKAPDDYNSIQVEQSQVLQTPDYNEDQQGMEVIRSSIRSITLAKAFQATEDEDQQGIEDIQTRMRSIDILQAREYEDGQAMEYIQKARKSLAPVMQEREYEDHQGIEYIQKPMKFLGPVMQEREYEDKQGIEYIRKPIKSLGLVRQEREYEDQGIECKYEDQVIENYSNTDAYIVARMRDAIKQLQARVLYKDRHGFEYFQKTMKSMALVMQEREYEYEPDQVIGFILKAMKSLEPVPQEDKQGMEYIQKAIKSLAPVLQEREYEDHQGIEYIQKPMKSLGFVPQEREYEDQQGIYYIQKTMKSLGPVLQEREYEDHQGIEYVPNPIKSLGFVSQEREYEYLQGFKHEDGVIYQYSNMDIYFVAEMRNFLEQLEVAESENQKGIDNIHGKEKPTTSLQLRDFLKDYGFESLDELVLWLKNRLVEGHLGEIDNILNNPETLDEMVDELDLDVLIILRAIVAIQRYKTIVVQAKT